MNTKKACEQIESSRVEDITLINKAIGGKEDE